MPSKSQSILLGAAVYIVVSLLLQVIGSTMQQQGGAAMLVGGISCLATLALAMVPVWHYTSTHKLTIPVGSGAGMGALSLVIGGVVVAGLSYALVATGVLPNPQDATLDQMEAQGATQEQIDMAMQFSSPLMMAGIGIVMGAILGAIGGAIGAAVFKKGEPTVPAEPL